MRLEITHTSPEFDTYRSSRVQSLFNVEEAHQFSVSADLPIEDMDWTLGPHRRAVRFRQNQLRRAGVLARSAVSGSLA